MGANSKIEWCHHTMNPFRGCTRVHTGCLNCYAERMSKRNPAVLGVWGAEGTRVVAAEKTWLEPLKWDKAAAKAGERHRVFCASLADVFEDWQGTMVDSDETELCVCHGCGRWKHYVAYCPEDCHEERLPRRLTMPDVRRRLFDLIDVTPNLDWQLVTKRPENISRMWPGGFRKNVWLLTSVSNQETADAMIPPLLQCRNLSPVLGLSMEPLVGPVEFSDVTNRSDAVQQLGKKAFSGISWVIVGGESGPQARPMRAEWAIDIRNQCQAAGVPFFFKQGSQANWSDFKDFDSFPPDLRVREFPKVSVQ